MQCSTDVPRPARPHPEVAASAPGTRSVTFGSTVWNLYGSTPLVVVTGRLDAASAPRLSAVLDHARRARGRAVAVDLRGVSVADSHGVAPILDAGAAICAASGAVRRVLAAPCPEPAIAGPRVARGSAQHGRG